MHSMSQFKGQVRCTVLVGFVVASWNMSSPQSGSLSLWHFSAARWRSFFERLFPLIQMVSVTAPDAESYFQSRGCSQHFKRLGYALATFGAISLNGDGRRKIVMPGTVH